MGQKKGQTGNPNGRPKGIGNKVSKELKEIIKDVLQNEFDVITETLQQLEPEKRLDIVIKLLPYAIPKLQNIESNSSGTKVVLVQLSEDAMNL